MTPHIDPAAERRDLRFGLEEAIDGELPADLVDRMIRHAENCPECADELDRLRRMKELVRRSCCTDAAPASLRERISVQYRSSLSVRQSQDGTTSSVRYTEYRTRRPD